MWYVLWESSSTSLSADRAKLSAFLKLLHGVRVSNKTRQPTKINHGSSSISRCTKHRLDSRWWTLQKSGTVQKICGGHDAWPTNSIQRALKDCNTDALATREYQRISTRSWKGHGKWLQKGNWISSWLGQTKGNSVQWLQNIKNTKPRIHELWAICHQSKEACE